MWSRCSVFLLLFVGCSNPLAEDNDGDGYTGFEDCNDKDPKLHPGDYDVDGFSPCEGDCDDDNPLLNPKDADGDGLSTCYGDCDDSDASLNDLDGDGDGVSSCDGDGDDGDASLNELDVDGDGVSTCDGDCDDANANVYNVGTSEDCPGQSCLELLNNGYSVGDGAYWLDPDGDGLNVFQTYCDMTTDDGGWTLVAVGDPDSADSDQYVSD